MTEALSPEKLESWRAHATHISAHDGWLYRILELRNGDAHPWGWSRYRGATSVALAEWIHDASFIEGNRRLIVVRARCLDGFDAVIFDVARHLPAGFALVPLRRLLQPRFAYAVFSEVIPVSSGDVPKSRR